MIKLGVAPRLLDFMRESFGPIDSWFNQVTARFGITSKAGAQAVAEVPTNQWGIFKNTTTGVVSIIINDNGTLKYIDAPNVSTTAPTFSAYQSVAQSIASGSIVKIQLQTEEWDTANAFDNVTNYRFTPQVAGYYLFTYSVGWDSGLTNVLTMLFKNGVRMKDSVLPSSGIITGGSGMLFLNGTTDYVELFGFQASGVAHNTSAAVNQTFLQGHFVRPA